LAINSVNTKPVSPARLAAFEVLWRVEGGAYSAIALSEKEEELDAIDRALCHELVLGVLRHGLWLDRLTEHYADRKISKLDLAVRIALRLGLYQLRFLSRIPASAAVNESVSLVRKARIHSAEGFVNAVLRRATREPEFDPAAYISNVAERWAVQTSHPLWLIDRWTRAFGEELTEKFARANNQPAPLAFRIVGREENAQPIVERLRRAEAELTPSEIVKGAWRVTGAGSLLQELVRAGEIYIQDEASQLVAKCVNAAPGERILDLCAAPGSKTTQISDNAGDGAIVVAGDRNESRLQTVVSSARRQRLSQVKCVVFDGLASLPFREGSFDCVLLDAPCSGTGTLRRNPEIRWRISPEDISELATRQLRLLLNGSKVVRPGGRLVYSTCSVEKEENEEVVSAFLRSNGRFKPVALPAKSAVKTAIGTLRTWPHLDGTDGFFIAAFECRPS